MTEPTNPKGKPRGRNGGRKPLTVPHKRYNVYLSAATIALLKQVNPSLSQAIELLVKEKESK